MIVILNMAIFFSNEGKKDMKIKQKYEALGISLFLVMATAGCQNNTDSMEMQVARNEEWHVIHMEGAKASYNDEEIPEFDYTWHISPDTEKPWYEGTEPGADLPVYIAHDIWYYPQLEESGFTKEEYDGETEWVYHYTAEGLTDYLFSTLPCWGDEVPKEMMHSEEEAYENKVLHITEPGTYMLEGTWHGQILVDLGDQDEVAADEAKKVTLILNGAEITCDCAPAVMIYSAYECDEGWEEREAYSADVDTSDAGAVVQIVDGTCNRVTGANIFRLLRPEYKKEGSTVQKKVMKYDGAFYSCVSMNIKGSDLGRLDIRSTTFEGLDSEHHLTIDGGYLTIYSQDDAINVNEDDVSVFTMNGGTLHIFAGLGHEGDGIDSNGYIVVNGGLIAGGTPSGADSLLDSDCGTTENGGEVITIGSQGFERGERPDGEGMFREKPDGEVPEFPPKDRPEMGQMPQPEDEQMQQK